MKDLCFLRGLKQYDNIGTLNFTCLNNVDTKLNNLSNRSHCNITAAEPSP